MAFKNLVAFGAGEITPELSERGTLDKFRTGLKKLRNGKVSKMGGLTNRAGTVKLFEVPEKSRMYVASNLGKVFVFTDDRYYVYSNYNEASNSFGNLVWYYYTLGEDPIYTQSNLDSMVFTISDENLYVFISDSDNVVFRISLLDNIRHELGTLWPYPPDIENGFMTIDRDDWDLPNGYVTEYRLHGVKDGYEYPDPIGIDSYRPIPANTNQAWNVRYQSTTKDYVLAEDYPYYDEVRVYRRTGGTGDWGYLGSMRPRFEDVVGINQLAKYLMVDFGAVPDYARNPPEQLELYTNDLKVLSGGIGPQPALMFPKTGLVYQDRLIFSGTTKPSRTFGTRTGTLSMTRDFPLQDDSAIGFALSSDGGGTIHRYFDGRGLVIATDVGIYETPVGVLKYNTAYANKKSNFVHPKHIPILGVSSNILAYDDRLKGLYLLTPVGQDYPYEDEEISVFSAHLFRRNSIKSWDIQSDFTQVLWCVMADGTIVTMAYQNDQMLRAFSWYDTDGKFLEVGVMTLENSKNKVLLKVKRGDKYYIEMMSDRDEESFAIQNFSDASKVFEAPNLEQDVKLYIPENSDIIDEMFLEGTGFTNTPNNGAVDSVFRVFNDYTDRYIEIRVTEFISATELRVVITADSTDELGDKRIPYDLQVLNPVHIAGDGTWCDRLLTFPRANSRKVMTVLDGLEHLDGKEVSIRKDGHTHASPLNDFANYNTYVVTDGEIVLNDDDYGSFIIVGLPYATDIQTLAVDTIEQSPVKLYSQINNKVWLSFNESRGCFIGSEYPKHDKVSSMEWTEDLSVPEGELDALTPILPYSKRDEYAMVGAYEAQSSICLRTVDPQPLGLKAIILDAEILRGG